MNAWAKYAKSFQMGFQNSLEYRLDFMLSLVSAVFPVVIQYFLWTAIYESSQEGVVYGYTYSQMITYTILAAVVTKLIGTGFEYDVLDDIKNGGLNKFIVKPIGYFFYRAACFFGSKLMFFLISGLLIAVALATLQFYVGLLIRPSNIALFALAVVFALALNFLIFFCIGTVSFWLTDVYHLFEAARIVIIVVSGGIFPTDILGPVVGRVLDWLPFAYTINFPVDVMNGRLGFAGIMEGLALQLVWIAVLTVIANLLWRRGMKSYSAVGG
ncbi:ABC transporter permease [Paenibacillus xanthanilyticus]|uniref:ABC transporter permease n=1 Tax=Paenibacillus xanthanilyticus TaxID=1783531 RepID=A0ABV8K5X9_9BACL